MIDVIARALAIKNSGGSTVDVEAIVKEQLKKMTIKTSITSDVSTSTDIIAGTWCETSIADIENSNIATYVTKISLPNDYDSIPVVLLEDNKGFLYNTTIRILNGYSYIYTNSIDNINQIIIKL